MAQLHWEMLASAATAAESEPLSVRKPFARQLRTTYSPAPTRPRRPGEEFRALVDRRPRRSGEGRGPPRRTQRGAEGEGAARRQARHRRRRADRRTERPRETAPLQRRASRPTGSRCSRSSCAATTTSSTTRGTATSTPRSPTASGWVFARGLLTPGRDRPHRARADHHRLERLPLGANLRRCSTERRQVEEARTEAGLLPSLADEFFKLGVRNYVGTAWEVNDVGRRALRARSSTARCSRGESFGEAVRRAREALWREPRRRTARSGPRTSTTATRQASRGLGVRSLRKHGRRRPARAATPRTSSTTRSRASAPTPPR